MLSLHINILLEHFSESKQLEQVKYPSAHKEINDFIGKKSLQTIEEFFKDFGSTIVMDGLEKDHIGVMIDAKWHSQNFATIVCLINNIRFGTGKFKDFGYVYTVIKFMVNEIEWITPDALGYKEINLSELPYDKVYPNFDLKDLLQF